MRTQSIAMNKFPEQGVLISHNHTQGSPFLHSSSSHDPDTDFTDVFGGPPRKSSLIQEARHSLSEPTEYGRETATAPFWPGRGEKPVFGEDSASNRRRFTSNDFFDDIFRGNDMSQSSSPRKKRSETDWLGSNPSSRISSPARTLKPRTDPFGTSLPSQFSLPSKLAGGPGIPTFGSPARNLDKSRNGASSFGIGSPFSPLLRSSNQGDYDGQDDPRSDVRSSYRKTEEVLSKPMQDGGEDENKISEVPDDVGLFHFSIYKWPSIGVPLHIAVRRAGSSSRLKERDRSKTTAASSGSTKPVYQESCLPPVDAYVHDDKCSEITEENHLSTSETSTSSGKNVTVGTSISSHAEEKANLATLVGMARKLREEEGLDAPDDHNRDMEKMRDHITIPSHIKEKTEVGSLSAKDMRGRSKRESSVVSSEARKSEHKPLGVLLHGDTDKLGGKKKEGLEKKEGQKPENPPVNPEASKKDKMMEKVENFSESGATVESSFLINSGDNRKGKVKGKVKEFVKIFNRGASVSSVSDADSIGTSSRWKSSKTIGEESGIHETKTDERIKAPDEQEKKRAGNVSEPSDENSEPSEKKDFNMKYTSDLRQSASKRRGSPKLRAQKVTGPPEKQVNDMKYTSELRHAVSKQRGSQESYTRRVSEPSGKEDDDMKFASNLRHAASNQADNPELNEASVAEDMDGSFRMSFQVTEIAQDDDKPSLQSNSLEDTQAIDAKIRKWSSGKKGNIRSLLSTLQFVLWPQSGWKPVALVDIIDGNAVKRSYQRALLCLHPDKLQQRGASDAHKYTAERVFEILQEAWNFFSSLESL